MDKQNIGDYEIGLNPEQEQQFEKVKLKIVLGVSYINQKRGELICIEVRCEFV